jgi:signal transduction histidine kinase
MRVRATPKPAVFGRDVEGVLAIGRCSLAVVFLIVLVFGESPGAPPLLVATIVYLAVGLLRALNPATLRRPRADLLVLALDVGYGAILLLGGAPLVLFIMLHTFAVLAGAALLGWGGALSIGGSFLAIYVAAFLDHAIPRDHLLIRVLYMVASALLVSRAAYDWEVARDRLLKVAGWASGRFGPSDDALRAVLRHAAEVLDGEGAVVIWRETGLVEQNRALYWRGRDLLAFDRTNYLEEAAPAAVLGKPFVLMDRRRQTCLTHDGPQEAPGAIPADVMALSATGEVIASDAFAGRLCEGRMFVFGVPIWRWDQLILVELVGKQVMARLEGRTLRARAARRSVELERARMARDLHDGILQSLTAARLMLQSTARLPADAAAVVAEASTILRDEQEKLRLFIEARRDEEPEEALASLGATIRAAAAKWRVPIAVDILTPEAPLPGQLFRDLSFLVTEAVANAARHGGAGELHARLAVRDGVVDLRLTNPATSKGAAVAPRSLSDRILALSGTLAVELTATEVIITIEAPIPEA